MTIGMLTPQIIVRVNGIPITLESVSPRMASAYERDIPLTFPWRGPLKLLGGCCLTDECGNTWTWDGLRWFPHLAS